MFGSLFLFRACNFRKLCFGVNNKYFTNILFYFTNISEMKYNSSNDKSEENASIAREHKRRNQASSIFGDPIAEERNSGRPVYNRDLMSNVF